jgi:hypothetical protein
MNKSANGIRYINIMQIVLKTIALLACLEMFLDLK